MKRINAVVFNPKANYAVSYWTFWLSVVLAPTTMTVRGCFSGWDLFEQVLLFISFYAVIETARNSVITCLTEKEKK